MNALNYLNSEEALCIVLLREGNRLLLLQSLVHDIFGETIKKLPLASEVEHKPVIQLILAFKICLVDEKPQAN